MSRYELICLVIIYSVVVSLIFYCEQIAYILFRDCKIK